MTAKQEKTDSIMGIIAKKLEMPELIPSAYRFGEFSNGAPVPTKLSFKSKEEK